MRKSKCSFILAPPQTTSIFEAGENESGNWRWTSGLDSTYTHWFPGGGWAGAGGMCRVAHGTPNIACWGSWASVTISFPRAGW